MTQSNFFAKFNNKHFFSLAGNVIMSGLSIIIMGILYRCLPNKAEMGNWVFFQTMFVLVEMFRTGFLTTATIKFYAGTEKERSAEVIGSAWALATGITFGLLLLNIPALLLVNVVKIEGLSFFLKWFGISYLFSLPSFIANCVMQAEARFDRLLTMRMVNQLSLLVFIIVLVFMHRLTLETLVYSNLLSLFLTSMFVLFKGWTNLWAWKYKTRNAITQLYHFGKYSVFGNISSYLLRGSDIFIISATLGAEAVAKYNIGLKLMEVIEIPLRSFIATAMPSLSAAYNRGLKTEMIYGMKKYAGLLTIALIPVCIASLVFAGVAVYLINGGRDMQAANVLRIFMTFSLLFPADRFIALGLDVIHKPNINFLKILAMLAVNIVTDFAGIAIFGNIYGVALATVFPVIVGIWIGYWSLRKYENFTLLQIPAVGYAELKILLREKFNFSKTFLP
ncbi:MAG TPA: oligosaccharide flippase family protein [Chitinophagaceae bacterium]|nr:oligosaccharide flippase family protein [Chitinophagaceae bacterium]